MHRVHARSGRSRISDNSLTATISRMAANSVVPLLAAVGDEEQRPKLRDAIVEAIMWAQTQPK
jgi:hypothetical protein